MLNALIALRALGYPDDHPEVLREQRELKKLDEKFAEAEDCFLRVVSDLNSRPVRPRVKVRVFLALARTQLEQKKLHEWL